MAKNNGFYKGSYYLTDNNYIVKVITCYDANYEFQGLILGHVKHDFAHIRNIEHITTKDELDKFIERNKSKLALPVLTYDQNGDAKGMLAYKLMKLIGWRAH